MENRLKSQTTGVIEILKDCNVRTVMATGDNVLTAISVARQCAILNPYKEVFLGDIGSLNGKTVVTWKSTKPY